MAHRIYLDNNASTQLDRRVLQAVIKELEEGTGNPSSIHSHGRRSRQQLDHTRQTIAHFLKVKPTEIFFTSSGTEGANFLIRGFFHNQFSGHIITSSVEHPCVYQSMKELEQRGCEVSFLSPGLWGAVRPEAVLEAIRPSTKLISLMSVNNETGVKTDVEAIAAIAYQANIPFIVDGVAWLGKEAISIPKGISALFFSGHKIHAPKGIGFVFCRSSLKCFPLILGGHQEFNRRSGSENLPAIVGLGRAVEILSEEQAKATDLMRRMRDRLQEGLKREISDIVINGQGPRIVNTLNVSFLGVDGESLLMNLDLEGVSVSHGSACTAGALEPSRILLNMGISLQEARTAIRFSVSRFTTEEEIDRCLEIIVKHVKRIRSR